MPKLVKSDVLLLKRYRHGDTSLVVHAFTREFGRVHFMAKGARSGGKKPPVPLVPVVELEFVWAPSTRSDLQLLREWSLNDGHGALHRDYTKLAWAQAALELLGRTLGPEDEHRDLYDHTVRFFHALADANGRYENLFILFRLQALIELGYEMSLDVPDASKPLAYLPGSGWMPREEVRERSYSGGVAVSPGSLKSLATLARLGYADAGRFRLSKDVQIEIDRLLDAIYRHSFDRWGKLESLKLLQPFDEGTPSPQPARPAGPEPGEGRS